MFLATVEDLFSRRMLGFAQSDRHPTAELAKVATIICTYFRELPMTSPTRTIPAAQFRDQCLKLMDEVNATGEQLIVTKHGRPVAAVVPVTERPEPSIIGWCPDIRIPDDLSEPAIAPESWHAVSDHERILTGIPREDRI